MNRIHKIFQDRTEKVIPFLTAGYPSKKDTVQMVLAAEESGAAMVELGMPFSDPLADGPIIQAASQKAIENGVNISWILEIVAEIRRESEIPLTLMGYINPIINYGDMNPGEAMIMEPYVLEFDINSPPGNFDLNLNHHLLDKLRLK